MRYESMKGTKGMRGMRDARGIRVMRSRRGMSMHTRVWHLGEV